MSDLYFQNNLGDCAFESDWAWHMALYKAGEYCGKSLLMQADIPGFAH